MLWYLLIVPRQGASKEYPQIMFSWRITREKIRFFISRSGHLLIIPNEPVKFQENSSNSFRYILLGNLKCKKFQRVIIQEKFSDFFSSINPLYTYHPLLVCVCVEWGGGGWVGEGGEAGRGKVWRRCRVSYVTGASNWYWLTVGQVLLSL